MRWKLLCIIVAKFALAIAPTPCIAAKPPDLPLEQKITCKENRPQESLIGIMFGIETNNDVQAGGVAQTACPYLQQKKAVANPTLPEGDLLSSVLANLKKLELGRELYEEGEYCRRTGHHQAACACYEKILRICPGSHCARLAGERLELYADTSVFPTENVEEEQESKTIEKANPRKRR
jgi:hypothetical protein